MTKVYYNEPDPFCAEWLCNLQRDNLIAPGDIDTRPIQNVRSCDLDGYAQHHFFAGIGIWSLALRRAGWPDAREAWTGSTPCQPFSVAGALGGFTDDRHLWPWWRYLIAVRRPAIVFGEQVASAAQWLRLVRGDLEALGYAVGAIPIEAASAGADHLRDRYWFVADDGGRRCDESDRRQGELARRDATERSGGVEHAARVGRRQGRTQHGVRSGRPAVAGAGSASDLADADESCGVEGREQRGGQQRGPGGDPQARDGGDVGHPDFARAGRNGGGGARTQAAGEPEGFVDGNLGDASCAPDSTTDFEWVIGADGKARRAKPGICLLVNGHSGRVAVRRPAQQAGSTIPEEHWYSRIGALKGLGNAIDSRPAAAFIAAYLDTLDNSRIP